MSEDNTMNLDTVKNTDNDDDDYLESNENQQQQQQQEAQHQVIKEKKNSNLLLTVTVEDYDTTVTANGEKVIMQKLFAPKRSASLLACVLKQYGFEHVNIDRQQTNEDCLTQIDRILKTYEISELENIILYLSGNCICYPNYFGFALETSNGNNQLLDLSLLSARMLLRRVPILIICDCLMVGNKFSTTIPSAFFGINIVSVVGTIESDIDQYEKNGYCYFTTMFCGMLARYANMETKKGRLTNATIANELNIVLNMLDKRVPPSLRDKVIRHEKMIDGSYSFPEFSHERKEIDEHSRMRLDQAFATLFVGDLQNGDEGLVNLQKLVDYEKIMKLKMDKRYTIVIKQLDDKEKPFNASVDIYETDGLGFKTNYIGHIVEIKHPFGKCKSPEEWFEETKEYDENLVVANAIEREIENYFNRRHLLIDNDDRQHAVVAQWMHSYGLKLAENVLGDHNHNVHEAFRDILGKGRLESFEIVGNNLFQSLHWESMVPHDGEISTQYPFYRKYISAHEKYSYAKLHNRKEIRILIVVARPAKEADLPYSEFARNLIQRVEYTKHTVYLHVLSCGTLEALSNQLQHRGSGFYDIVHFDVHGGSLSYEQLKAGIVFDKYSLDIKPIVPGSGNDVDNLNIVKVENIAEYKAQYSNGGSFQGEKMFLFFEPKEKYFQEKQTHAVDFDKVKRIFQTNAVFMVTFGCSLTRPKRVFDTDNKKPYFDFLSDFFNCNVSIVVGPTFKMPYRKFNSFMLETYYQIVEGKTFGDAFRFSREVPKPNSGKQDNKNLFFLPIMLGDGDVKFELEAKNYDSLEGDLVPDRYYSSDLRMVEDQKHEPLIGRDQDFYQIDRLLLTDMRNNMLHIKGSVGIGKTLLMQKLGMYWRQAHLIANKILYYEFKTDIVNFTMDKWIQDLAFQLNIDPTYKHEVKMQAISKKFREIRYLLILDDVDQLTNKLTEKQKEEFCFFIRCLRGIASLVLVGSENDIKWLNGYSVMNRLMDTYELGPLDKSQQKQMILWWYSERQGQNPADLNDSIYDSIDVKTKGNPALVRKAISKLLESKKKKFNLKSFLEEYGNNYY